MAIAAAGAFVQLRGDSVVDCGIGLTAVGADHFACSAAEDYLRGKPATAEHFAAALVEGHADAVLAASRFHFEELSIADVKRFLADSGIEVRQT